MGSFRSPRQVNYLQVIDHEDWEDTTATLSNHARKRVEPETSKNTYVITEGSAPAERCANTFGQTCRIGKYDAMTFGESIIRLNAVYVIIHLYRVKDTGERRIRAKE